MKKLTLLAIVSGLTASALTAAPNPQTNTNLLTGGTYYTLADGSRADLITSGSFTAADNVLRTAGANYAVAIFVDTDGAAFTGSNLTIYTGIKMDADGNPLTAGGDLATDPSQYVYSGTPGAKNINYNYGIIARNGAAVEVAAVNIMTFSHIEGNGLMAENARLIANNVAIVINTYSYANGGLAHNLGYLEIDGGTINTFNLNASEGGSGLTAWHSGTVVARHLTINAQIGANVYAGSVTVADSVIHADQKAYHTSVIPSGTGTVGQLDIINTVAVSDDVGLATEGGGSLVNISGGSLDAAGDLIISSGTGTKDLVLDRLTSATGSNALRVIGSNTTTVTVKHTDVSGQTQVSGTTTTTVTLDDSALTGDLTASEDATIAVTVSGSRSALLGDIEQNDRAVVTVILDDHATGRGGFNGGNLITDGDSAWTFDKDSHGNYGENNGTWNIGDYNVTFDNLTHTGTLTISVNSDTGDGGSIIVIGTADGDGTVHIDTTGNGQADPNQVLPGIVSGDGTEHWQWDPIDWGIDTIIKDGDHFIKQGTSSAGAVLNSAIAVQQSMWFAQQNSLLKRMGDLRYGARASRPLADKDVRVPYHSLIENIWLRSYGQQLNVGSQVSGKAYEQLIYGVDLGTDHKLTISADSDLYLGVYAGYGRSDIDYRTPGADGEINSYYGGLYATWLHSSGFYIDATIKAASVDNDLKAPYGDTQLKASYSDVNLGGSLELGNKFTFKDDWFIEPQLQVNYLHILAEDYTAGPLTISAQDLDALQLRIGSLFGRTINLTNSGALQPYVKISGIETISSGGTLRNGYQHTRANTDGARAEVGGGLIWQLDADNQLHLDYEASFGDKYDKPWGLTAGYRHQF